MNTFVQHLISFAISVCDRLLFLQAPCYNRHQRVRLGDIRTEWSAVTKGVTQGSILGPILFNVFINDIFFLDCACRIYNYADDNCISYSSATIGTIRNFLTNDIIVFIDWFKQNYLKANPENFQSMLISSHGCDHGGLVIPVDNTMIASTERMKVLVVTIDDMLNFTFCIKWLSSSYHDLLNKSEATGIKIITLRLLAIEFHKCVNNLSPEYLNEMFTMKNCPYDFHDNSILERLLCTALNLLETMVP